MAAPIDHRTNEVPQPYQPQASERGAVETAPQTLAALPTTQDHIPAPFDALPPTFPTPNITPIEVPAVVAEPKRPQWGKRLAGAFALAGALTAGAILGSASGDNESKATPAAPSGLAPENDFGYPEDATVEDELTPEQKFAREEIPETLSPLVDKIAELFQEEGADYTVTEDPAGQPMLNIAIPAETASGKPGSYDMSVTLWNYDPDDPGSTDFSTGNLKGLRLGMKTKSPYDEMIDVYTLFVSTTPDTWKFSLLWQSPDDGIKTYVYATDPELVAEDQGAQQLTPEILEKLVKQAGGVVERAEKAAPLDYAPDFKPKS